jgi:hypothetical protein
VLTGILISWNSRSPSVRSASTGTHAKLKCSERSQKTCNIQFPIPQKHSADESTGYVLSLCIQRSTLCVRIACIVKNVVGGWRCFGSQSSELWMLAQEQSWLHGQLNEESAYGPKERGGGRKPGQFSSARFFVGRFLFYLFLEPLWSMFFH